MLKCLAVLLIVPTVAAAQQSAPVRSDQDILIQLEHDWDAAFHRHDAAFIDRILADEFIVKEFGNTAVVWFTLHLVGPVNGERVQNDYRFTDVFVLRDGRWQCVSSQSTRIDRNSHVGP